MRLNISVKLASISLACLLLSCNKNASITKVSAIAKAEQFIVEQGYTDLPASITKIKFEKGEFASDTTKILNYRKNTLERKAFAAKRHAASWTVGFMYINKENNIGRAVTMDTLGVNIIMQAKEVRLDWFHESSN